MIVPYSAAFAVLCVAQGVLVAPGWRERWAPERLRWVGLVVPLALFAIGLSLIRAGDVSTRGLANAATFVVPLLAAGVGWARGWRAPGVFPPPVAALFVVAWRADGIVADVAALALTAGSCLTVAALIAALAPRWALAVGLVVLAIVDAVLVFSDQVGPATDALRQVVPPEVGGRPLPTLQDATLDRSLMGWMDLLAPALAGTLLASRVGWRMVGAGAVAVASLAWGLMFHVVDHLPGTVPPLVAVAVWLVAARHSEDPVRAAAVPAADRLPT